MSWVALAIGGSAAVGAGASIYSGITGANAAKDASQIQAQSAQQGLAFQKDVFNKGQENLAPYLGLGKSAVGTIGGLYGYGGGGAGGKPDYSAFTNSPDYNFAFTQGRDATQNTLNASGNLRGGAGAAALTNFGQGLASQQYGNYFSRLMGMAGMGQQAAGQGLNFGATMGGQISQQYGNIGQANASGVIGAANAYSGAATGVANAANSYASNSIYSRMMSGTGTAYGSPGNYGGSPATNPLLNPASYGNLPPGGLNAGTPYQPTPFG